MSAPAKKKSRSHQEKNPGSQPNNKDSAVLEGLGRVMLRFERFGRDVIGITVFVFCLVSVLALLGLTEGSFISPWGTFLRRWLGVGSYLVVVLCGYLGFLILKRGNEKATTINLGRILALECLVFTILILLAISGGLSMERAERGLDGGIIGWGLARLVSMLLPLPWSTLLVVLLAAWMLAVIIGLGGFVVRKIEEWLATQPASSELVQLPLPDAGSKHGVSVEEFANQDAATTGIPVQVVTERKSENLPPLTLLSHEETNGLDEERILAIANKIETTLAEFSIPSRVIGYRVGPTVTQFAVEPGFVEKAGPDGIPFKQKVRVSQISGLTRDLALALAAERLRIEAPVPGHSYVGVEVPNTNTTLVRLRSVLESEEFQRLDSVLAIALGRDVSGQPVAADLARMPHLLVAGTTGSGKSVCLAAIITCLVMNNSPEALRLAILDPKMVELVRFNGLPHILGKVETEIDRMLAVLRWALVEMDQRYRVLESANTRDLEAYNRKLKRQGQAPLPRIVIIIDELADLMMTATDQTEHSLVRLAQMARATGIHLVIATQRPSTDVVTGLIKANFPARIAFSVASSIDSRVILDVNGAESLLGRGDMLFLNPEVGTPLRTQGVMLRDQEVNRVVGFWQRAIAIKDEEEAPWEEMVEQDEQGGDDLINDAIALVRKAQRASASLLQRRMRIGFPRAARLLDELEEMGIVGPSQGGGKDREVLIDPDDDDDNVDHTHYEE
jgi:DNA segregation ATPase FtsK/SpoIIIE, S-DNA-T family